MNTYLPNLKFEMDEKKLIDRLEAFPKEYSRAIAKALNRAGKTVETDSVKIITARYNLKRDKVKRKFRVTLAKNGSLVSRVIGKDYNAFHISDYGAKQTKKGVSFKILKKGKRQLLKNAFIAHSKKSNKAIVFIRSTKKRYPIEAKYTTSGLNILTDKKIQKELQMKAAQNIRKNLLHEASYRLSKLEG